jgi:3-isopropylmalate dehydrogenase
MSAAMLLRHSLDLDREADAVEDAVERTLETGARTADLGGEHPISTAEMGRLVCEHLD